MRATHVFTSLRVVSGRGREAQRPLPLARSHSLMKGGHRNAESCGVAAHFIEGDQAVIPVQSGILNAFCRHRAGRLLKFHDERRTSSHVGVGSADLSKRFWIKSNTVAGVAGF